jgi:DNA polymerase III subunit chi
MAVKVEVLTGVSDPLLYVCKYLRKSLAAASSHMVCGPQEQLRKLDALLWTFDAHSFIAHAWASAGASSPNAVGQHTKIWLSTHCDAAAGCTVLVNLHDEAPSGWQAFERVLEFVGIDDQQVAAGRQRWKAYGALSGVERIHHAVKA